MLQSHVLSKLCQSIHSNAVFQCSFHGMELPTYTFVETVFLLMYSWSDTNLYLTLLIVQSELCGHGTLAAAHYLISSGLVEGDAVEFVAKSGRLTAKKIVGSMNASPLHPPPQNMCSKFLVELDFPVIPVVKCNSVELMSLPDTLNGASIINELQTVSAFSDLIVIPFHLPSTNPISILFHNQNSCLLLKALQVCFFHSNSWLHFLNLFELFRWKLAHVMKLKMFVLTLLN